MQCEIEKYSSSYASAPAKDYAEYMHRVGLENGLKTALIIVEDSIREWNKNDE